MSKAAALSDPHEPLPLGRHIRRLRRARQLTSAALAAGAGISQPFVIEIEQGKKTPSIGTLRGIARALQVPLASLMDDGAAPGRLVPLVDAAACAAWLAGDPLDMQPNGDGRWVWTHVADPEAFWVVAAGPDMAGDRVHEGDWLLVSPAAEAAAGDLVLAEGRRSPVLGRLQGRGPARVVCPLTTGSSPELPVLPDDRLGRVVCAEIHM